MRVADLAGAEQRLSDRNQIGIFDAAQRAKRRFGALFDVEDAFPDYGGRPRAIVPPAPGRGTRTSV